MKKNLLLIILFLLLHEVILAQKGKTQSLLLTATALGNGGLSINWPMISYAGQYKVFKKRINTEENWGSEPLAVVAGNLGSYVDNTVKQGEAFEYFVIKANGSTNEAFGNIFGGNMLKEPTKFGGVILLIDSNYLIPLAAEIETLSNDLKNEGMLVHLIYAGRNQTPPQVKSAIQAVYANAKKNIHSLFIIGHVPVPYSGNFSTFGDVPPPDGHVEGSGDHTGAWPADVYYADMQNFWTDNMVNCTTGSSTRNHNIPGDGKFDQSKLPDTLVLELGRVDLFNMPAFGKSDTVLTKNYLTRNHLFRTGMLKATERSLIDDNFTTLNLSSTGYNNFSALIPADSNFTNRDYFTAQKSGSYLWSYGCGAGSYTSCSGIGNTNNFVNDSFQNIFTILAGSFFGDWDNTNNFLKAPLAQSSLVSFWGGIPKWHVFHMGLGYSIGYGAKLTQNNKGFYFDGGFNASGNSVHVALMGDPTLKMRYIEPVKNLTAQSVNNLVKLNWTPVSGNIDGYAVYKIDTNTNTYLKLNSNIIKGTSFTDSNNYFSGNYTYAVKTIKLENTPSGSYYNIGGASFAKVQHTNSVANIPNALTSVSLFPNPSAGIFEILFNNSIFENSTVTIHTVTGKQVFQQVYNYSNPITINIQNQPVGIYLVSIQTNNGLVVKKIVKN